MRERPILFSGAMVRALLAGTKTQTRRALKVQPLDVLPMNSDAAGRKWISLVQREPEPKGGVFGCRFGKPGDRLWVRESLKAVYDEHGYIADYAYSADSAKVPRCPDLAEWASDATAFVHLQRPGGVPSIHMPRWACRLVLEITGVRVERLGEITAADAKAEGIEGQTDTGPWRNYLRDGYWFPEGKNIAPQLSFASLWQSINGANSWQSNPWVWVVEFKRVTP